MDALVAHASYHRVPGVVYRSLCDLGVDRDQLSELRSIYQMATLSHQRCLTELHSMTSALEGLTWMVVKGPVLTELGYGDPGARLYEDLDIVVAAGNLVPSLQAIELAGGQVTDLNWPMMVKLRRAEIPMYLPQGMLADLHWHLLVTPNIRARFSMPMSEVFERRRTLLITGIEVDTLDPVDGLLYLCLHGSLSGGDQLVWLKDLERMIASERIDWDELARRARRYRVDLVAAMQLERARAVLAAEVPESLPTALARNRAWWRRWQVNERKVGLARWGDRDLSDHRFVAATSAGSAASAFELARAVASDMAVHYLGSRGSTAESSEEVPELYQPQGETDARERYLELAAATPCS
jgi:hypothetical protein